MRKVCFQVLIVLCVSISLENIDGFARVCLPDLIRENISSCLENTNANDHAGTDILKGRFCDNPAQIKAGYLRCFDYRKQDPEPNPYSAAKHCHELFVMPAAVAAIPENHPSRPKLCSGQVEPHDGREWICAHQMGFCYCGSKLGHCPSFKEHFQCDCGGIAGKVMYF